MTQSQNSIPSSGTARRRRWRCPTSQLGFVTLLSLSGCGAVSETAELEVSDTQQAVVGAQQAVLTAIADARVQPGSSIDTNFGDAQLWINTEASHYSYVEFDLSELPANVVIDSAQLVLRYTGNYALGERSVEVGRIDQDWAEDTVTWSSDLDITWGGAVATVGDEAADIKWDVTQLVRSWYSGARPNEGLALRGQGNGPGKIFHSTETSPTYAPKLIIRHQAPMPTGVIPDLGDAPDSSNHHGQANTAYPGVLGQFPTVWNMGIPAAGPKHDNNLLEGFLGNFITAENDADIGPDADGSNNIIRNAAGSIVNVANLDRADEGWLNRDVLFFNCQRQTLDFRVSKTPNATEGLMYLNVWFDGTHDGDWGDVQPCVPPAGGPAQPSFEWIVQNELVDMTAIAAGSYADLSVNTERVLNVSPGMAHWMRFTLSETPATVPAGGGLPDGRGPHPGSAQHSFKLGETEDYLQYAFGPGEVGDLVLEKKLKDQPTHVAFGEMLTYQIRLRHVGGTAAVQAKIRDLLPTTTPEVLPLGVPTVTGTRGGAGPLQADLAYNASQNKYGVMWDGVLAPNSEVVIEFPVRYLPNCFPIQSAKTFTNVATASADGETVSSQVSVAVDCQGEVVAVPHESPDLSALPPYLP
jgi:hypothetical protein